MKRIALLMLAFALLAPAVFAQEEHGEVGVFAGSAIHAIDYPDRSRFIRVTGTNLDAIERVSYDEQTGRIKRMGAQQAT